MGILVGAEDAPVVCVAEGAVFDEFQVESGGVFDDGEVVDEDLATVEEAEADFVEVVLVRAVGGGVGGEVVSVGLPVRGGFVGASGPGGGGGVVEFGVAEFKAGAAAVGGFWPGGRRRGRRLGRRGCSIGRGG